MGTGRGTSKNPVRREGDREANLYPCPVTEKCRPPHVAWTFGLRRMLINGMEFSESYKNDDRAGGSDL